MRYFKIMPVLLGLLLTVMAQPVLANSDTNFDFSLQDFKGKTHKLSDYRGSWVLVNFWATWCPPCREEMPALSDLHEGNKDIIVLGINYHETDMTKVTDFLDGMLLDFPSLILPPGKDISGIKPIYSLPTSLLVSPKGEIVAQFSGVVNIEGVEQFIQKQ